MTFTLGLSLHALSEAVRLACELEDVGLVCQPVEQGRRQSLVTKDLCPVSKAQVGLSYLEYESVVECSQDPRSTVRVCPGSEKEEREQCVR